MPEFEPMRRELSTDRLVLRRWQLSDAAALRGLWVERDPRALRLIDSSGRPNVEDMRGRLATQLEEAGQNGFELLAIERKSAPGVIGYCGLTVGSATPAEPELAFELYRASHGHGYATEAARAIVDAARETGRSRLWASVREWNAASFNVLNKLGFLNSGQRVPDPIRGDSVWMTLEL